MPAAAKTPLRFTLYLPNAKLTNLLFPASHLQVVFTFQGTGSMFLPRFIASADLEPIEGEENLYEAKVAGGEVPRVKVNEGQTTDATVSVNAWKGEKLLGKFEVGGIDGLGFEGLKSEPIHKRRVEQWNKMNA
jgi:hypothetical protein